MSKKFDTKRLAVCAVLSALGVVVIWLGSIISVMDLSMAVIASLFSVIAVIEYGKGAPWLVYAVTAILSMLILPEKTGAFLYLCFFGYYPIIKEKLEQLKRPVAWLLKELIFNVFLALSLIASKFLFSANASEPVILYVIYALLFEIVFPLYDIALTRLITFYIRKLRSRFKFK